MHSWPLLAPLSLCRMCMHHGIHITPWRLKLLWAKIGLFHFFLFSHSSILYLVDAWEPKLMSLTLNGNHVLTSLADLSSKFSKSPIFGLVVKGTRALISTWGSCSLLEVNLLTGATTELVKGLGTDVLFSIATVDEDAQPRGSHLIYIFFFILTYIVGRTEIAK